MTTPMEISERSLSKTAIAQAGSTTHFVRRPSPHLSRLRGEKLRWHMFTREGFVCNSRRRERGQQEQHNHSMAYLFTTIKRERGETAFNFEAF